MVNVNVEVNTVVSHKPGPSIGVNNAKLPNIPD